MMPASVPHARAFGLRRLRAKFAFHFLSTSAWELVNRSIADGAVERWTEVRCSSELREGEGRLRSSAFMHPGCSIMRAPTITQCIFARRIYREVLIIDAHDAFRGQCSDRSRELIDQRSVKSSRHERHPQN